jgi:hypothetical protein
MPIDPGEAMWIEAHFRILDFHAEISHSETFFLLITGAWAARAA